MDAEITLDDICLLNSNKVNWTNMNYVNYYAARKVKSYVDLKKFLVEHPKISLSGAIILLSSKRRDVKGLKKGGFIADKVDKAHLIMKYIYDLKEAQGAYLTFWKGTNFIEAMKNIVATKKYQHHVMMASSVNNAEGWEPQINIRSYVHEIQRVYNYGRGADEKVNFVQLLKGEL